jgi:hypothetical protein
MLEPSRKQPWRQHERAICAVTHGIVDTITAASTSRGSSVAGLYGAGIRPLLRRQQRHDLHRHRQSHIG